MAAENISRSEQIGWIEEIDRLLQQHDDVAWLFTLKRFTEAYSYYQTYKDLLNRQYVLSKTQAGLLKIACGHLVSLLSREVTLQEAYKYFFHSLETLGDSNFDDTIAYFETLSSFLHKLAHMHKSDQLWWAVHRIINLTPKDWITVEERNLLELTHTPVKMVVYQLLERYLDFLLRKARNANWLEQRQFKRVFEQHKFRVIDMLKLIVMGEDDEQSWIAISYFSKNIAPSLNRESIDISVGRKKE